MDHPTGRATELGHDPTSDIDGKYRMENVSGGNYYLYAIHASNISFVEWMKKIRISESGTTTVDFSNDSAEVIANKFSGD